MFNTQGSLSSQPTLGIMKNFQPAQNSGVLSNSIGSGLSMASPPSMQNSGLNNASGQSMQSPVYSGVLPTSLSPNTHTITTNTGGGTSTKPAPNPSVLAQQQALNKLGAGLVEDGIAGPLTKAAIAKYGNGNSTSSSTESSAPAIAPTTSADKFDRTTGQPNPSYVDPNAPPAPTPAPLTVGGQLPGLLASGNQTPNEASTLSNLQSQSQNPSQAYTDATNKYQQAVQNLKDLKTNLAKYDQGIEAQGIPMAGIVGQEANLSKSAAAQLDAAQQAVTEAKQAMSYANTQQGLEVQAGTAANSAAQTTAQRGTSVAGTAVGAVAPITGITPGTQTVQPGLLETSTGGVSGGISDADMQQYAQMAAKGQLNGVPSFITSNPVLNAQLNNAAKKINSNYNPVTSSAQSAITTQQTGNVAGMTAAYKSATNLGSQLKDLISTYGANPSDLNAANAVIQKVAQNVSSAQYQALHNLVTDLVATYSSILTPGSTTDTARATATSLLNDTASGKSIITTLNNLDDQAKAKIAGQITGYGETPGNSNNANAENIINTPYGNINPQL